MRITEIVLHPDRLRIIFAGMDGHPFTTSDMGRRLPDISKATLYRHIALLAEQGLLEVENETLVNGITERHYRLLRLRAIIDPAAAAAMTKEDHRHGFAAVATSLLAEFSAYLDKPESNPTADSVSYRQFPLWLTEAERAALIADVAAAIQKRMAQERTPGRQRHLLTTIFFPTETTMHDPDLSALRQLVDEGNEAAGLRLTELAAQRGDVEELRRLVDGGSEEAARQLTQLAAQRGDVEELRRLVDAGSDDAGLVLAELARHRGDIDELRRLADEGNEQAEAWLAELIIERTRKGA